MTGANFPAAAHGRRLPNLFDMIALLALFGLFAAFGGAARSTLLPLAASQSTAIHLDPAWLPYYALRTTLRMFAALFASLLFTFTYAPIAAKSRRAGLVMIPALDILQSVPILGFLTFTVTVFMGMFPGKVLGAELASIFVIFTSQAWNMAFSFHQSLTTLPRDLAEACDSFRLSPWQRFWKLEVPFAMPGLVWNTMMSMSGGWFFVVASEAVSVGNTSWTLPGVGSYIAVAQQKGDIAAVFYAILAMLVVILAYDQLLFRPLVAWSAKFRFETTARVEEEDPWMLKLFRRTALISWAIDQLAAVFAWFGSRRLKISVRLPKLALSERVADGIFGATLAIVVVWAVDLIFTYVSVTLRWSDLLVAVLLGCITLARVMVLIVLASLLWVPVGVWLGLRPVWAKRIQPLAQFLAAFPANLFFPVFVLGIVHFRLMPDIWLTPLMILGTQWYILFNVIAGATAFPGDLLEVSKNFRLKGWLWWRRVILPGIFPYFVTGALTASGGAWNASIVAELVSWHGTTLMAHGLGTYIEQATLSGDTPRVVLGVAVMSMFVVVINRLLWRRLAAYSTRRLSF